jgi:hypothetical protein
MPERPGSAPARPASAGSSPRAKKFVVPERRRRRNPNATPGPGAYDIGGLSRSTGGTSPRSPGWGFGSAARSGRGSLGFAGLDSPGPAKYDVRGTSRRDGGMKGRLQKGAFSFPGSPNRPSAHKDQRSPGPIYYYPDCEHDSDHTTGAKYTIDRTAHSSHSARTFGPGPRYNLRDGRVGNKVLAIGDVTHKTAQWATCAPRPPTKNRDRRNDGPGPAHYDPADMNKCSQNSEQAPSYTMGVWVPFGDLPVRPVPKGAEASTKVEREPGIGPKYDVSAKAGGALPNKADPPAFSFSKDERFWEDE